MDLRFRLLVFTFVGVIAGAVWTFPSWRGYLRDTSVNEAFPGLALDFQDEFLTLPLEEREALLEMIEEDPDMALEMAKVAVQENKDAPESEQDMGEMETASVLVTGNFIEIDPLHWGKGSATIYQLSEQQRVLRFQDYSSARGGDVFVYLSRDPEPRTAVEMGVDFLDLGRLKGNIGNQNYTLPANLDLSGYRSVVIFCRQFNTVITVANLR
jgi:hypothetical protein